MPSGSLIGDSQKVSVSNSLVTYFWSGANDTNAPDATNIEFDKVVELKCQV